MRGRGPHVFKTHAHHPELLKRFNVLVRSRSEDLVVDELGRFAGEADPALLQDVDVIGDVEGPGDVLLDEQFIASAAGAPRAVGMLLDATERGLPLPQGGRLVRELARPPGPAPPGGTFAHA